MSSRALPRNGCVAASPLFSHLLRGVAIEPPSQVWCADPNITFAKTIGAVRAATDVYAKVGSLLTRNRVGIQTHDLGDIGMQPIRRVAGPTIFDRQIDALFPTHLSKTAAQRLASKFGSENPVSAPMRLSGCCARAASGCATEPRDEVASSH
jgi:hypothetical protein